MYEFDSFSSAFHKKEEISLFFGKLSGFIDTICDSIEGELSLKMKDEHTMQ